MIRTSIPSLLDTSIPSKSNGYYQCDPYKQTKKLSIHLLRPWGAHHRVFPPPRPPPSPPPAGAEIRTVFFLPFPPLPLLFTAERTWPSFTAPGAFYAGGAGSEVEDSASLVGLSCAPAAVSTSASASRFVITLVLPMGTTFSFFGGAADAEASFLPMSNEISRTRSARLAMSGLTGTRGRSLAGVFGGGPKGDGIEEGGLLTGMTGGGISMIFGTCGFVSWTAAVAGTDGTGGGVPAWAISTGRISVFSSRFFFGLGSGAWGCQYASCVWQCDGTHLSRSPGHRSA